MKEKLKKAEGDIKHYKKEAKIKVMNPSLTAEDLKKIKKSKIGITSDAPSAKKPTIKITPSADISARVKENKKNKKNASKGTLSQKINFICS